MKHILEKIDRKTLALVGIIVALVITPLYDGGNGWVASSFLMFLAFPVFYFAWEDDRGTFFATLRKPINILFILFLCSVLISVYFSADKFTSAVGFLVWLSTFIFFISIQAPFSERHRSLLMYAIVAIASLISLVGFYYFFSSIENFNHLRLESTFYQHNALGGYLLIPLAMSIAFFLNSKRRLETYLLGASSILLLTALVFTFSRGSWASIIGSGVIALYIFKKKIKGVLNLHLPKILFLLGLTLLLGLSFYGIKSFLAKDANSNITLYGGETLSENTVTVRLHYFRDALLVIRENPIFGVGYGHYGEAAKKYKDEPAYYTSHPHNILLKFAAELGIPGALIFLLLILLLFVNLYSEVRKAGNAQKLFAAAVFLGFTAALLHNLVDIDWTYSANIFIFFLLAGLLIQRISSPETNGEPIKKSSVFMFVSAIAFVPFVISIPLLLSWYFFQQASVYGALEDADKAINNAKKSIEFNPWNSAPYFMLTLAYQHLAEINPDSAQRDILAKKGLDYVNKALVLKPEKPLFYSQQALLYRYLGDIPNEEQALLNTIRFTPTDAIYEYRGLAKLYLDQKRYDAVIELLRPLLPMYPLSLWQNIYWANPEKDRYKLTLSDLYTLAGLAYEGRNEITNAKEGFAKALLYNPKNAFAGRKLTSL